MHHAMPMSDVPGRRHEFYTLAGTASGTMVGLLSVAASVASGVFSSDRPAPLRVFLSASVFNSTGVLVTCLILLSPLESWSLLGIAIIACGTFGLPRSCMA